MKKLLAILLALTILFSFAGCAESENPGSTPVESSGNHQEENTTATGSSQTLQLKEYWYDTVDWDSLEEKDPDWLLFGISAAPFNIMDFASSTTDILPPALHTEDNKLIMENKPKDFEVLFQGTLSAYSTLETTSSDVFCLDLSNGASCRFSITASGEEADHVQSIRQSIEQGKYFYHSNYYVDQFLNMDMSGEPEYKLGTSGNDGNVIPLLEKILESFGKPTACEVTLDEASTGGDGDFMLGYMQYILIYEYEDYVLYIPVIETQGVYASGQGGYQSSGLSVRVYGKGAWEDYKIEKGQ